ncbi:hypothetical protein BDV96DRAFT_153439 [Lophiotrema nucula]|uniref:Uncharacterized protein n=1 Tax=Lophiotrema nucula TaxID=690887 RepID=A0A6A5Z185_9PLEO|nr:hypothetical protein BDV96DRAFT_153439 [Lophiotrema nucula]
MLDKLRHRWYVVGHCRATVAEPAMSSRGQPKGSLVSRTAQAISSPTHARYLGSLFPILRVTLTPEFEAGVDHWTSPSLVLAVSCVRLCPVQEQPSSTSMRLRDTYNRFCAMVILLKYPNRLESWVFFTFKLQIGIKGAMATTQVLHRFLVLKQGDAGIFFANMSEHPPTSQKKDDERKENAETSKEQASAASASERSSSQEASQAETGEKGKAPAVPPHPRPPRRIEDMEVDPFFLAALAEASFAGNPKKSEVKE